MQDRLMHRLNFGPKPLIEKADGDEWVGVLDVWIKGLFASVHPELVLEVPNFLAYVI